MSNKREGKTIGGGLPVPDVQINDPVLMKRDIEMFEKWKNGQSVTDIAAEYGLAQQTVSLIKKRYNWQGLMNEVKRRAFKASLDSLKDIQTELTRGIKHDIRKLSQRVIKEDREFTKDERLFVTALLDRVDRITRLEDGKPTENTGVLSVELKLPPGVKHYGIIPPDPRVKYVTAEVDDSKPVIDLDALEEGDDK
jgi:hypothetical protein